jgi:hypothetical protein
MNKDDDERALMDQHVGLYKDGEILPIFDDESAPRHKRLQKWKTKTKIKQIQNFFHIWTTTH